VLPALIFFCGLLIAQFALPYSLQAHTIDLNTTHLTTQTHQQPSGGLGNSLNHVSGGLPSVGTISPSLSSPHTSILVGTSTPLVTLTSSVLVNPTLLTISNVATTIANLNISSVTSSLANTNLFGIVGSAIAPTNVLSISGMLSGAPIFTTHPIIATPVLSTDKTRMSQDKTVVHASPPTAITVNDSAHDDGKSWYIVGTSCQPFSFEGDSEETIVGSPGTVFAPKGVETILLKEGKIIALAGKQSMIIETVQGKVDIPAGGSSMIEETASGVLRIANLNGAEQDIVVESEGHTTFLSAKPGEQVVLADTRLGDEELIPVDGITREPITSSIVIAGVKVEKLQFDRQLMSEKEVLLQCNSGAFTLNTRKKFITMKRSLKINEPSDSKLTVLPSKTKISTNRVNRFNGQQAPEQMKPVSYVYAQ